MTEEQIEERLDRLATYLEAIRDGIAPVPADTHDEVVRGYLAARDVIDLGGPYVFWNVFLNRMIVGPDNLWLGYAAEVSAVQRPIIASRLRELAAIFDLPTDRRH